MAEEARGHLAACVENLGRVIAEAGKRIAAGERHGLSSSTRVSDNSLFLSFMRCGDAVPAEVIGLVDRALAAIRAYSAEGETYYGGCRAVRAVPPEHSDTMRVMMGTHNDVAFRERDEVAWDDPEDAAVWYTGEVLAVFQNLASICRAKRHVRGGGYSLPTDVPGLPAIDVALLRPFHDWD
jgi:hypothetical protein